MKEHGNKRLPQKSLLREMQMEIVNLYFIPYYRC
jgi:hypothetical protein